MEATETVERTMRVELTPLELDLLAQFHARYDTFGFPPPSRLRVLARKNTGAGRFTYLDHDGLVRMPDGQLDLGTYSQFDMAGLEAGATFWVKIQHAKVAYLEIVVNGEKEWDGSEQSWAVVDPDSGELGAERDAV